MFIYYQFASCTAYHLYLTFKLVLKPKKIKYKEFQKLDFNTARTQSDLHSIMSRWGYIMVK